MTADQSSDRKHRLPRAVVILACGIGLTALFWGPLWQGGGFIGGDLYPYFLPQKQTYQEALHRGEPALWNDRVGHGYPQLAESQTGVFYPTHPPLYALLDLNTAYAADHLLHYVIAFCGMACLVRSLGLSLPASLLGGLVYVYGWFPARASLEWAIIGGAWVPWSLWTIERFLATKHWRFPIALSALIAFQLLAGHFNLAFINLVLCGASPSRTFYWLPQNPQQSPSGQPVEPTRRGRMLLALGGAVVCGFLLAAVQLGPSWELKLQSQRSSVDGKYSIAYGNMPPEYLSQFVLHLKWFVLQQDQDELLRGMSWANWGAGTNKAEAHLYFGLAPLALLLFGLFLARREPGLTGRSRAFWWILALLALTYTFGWWLPVTQYLPGFSFFQGPGRWGLITALAGGILAADSADRIRYWIGRSGGPLFWGVVLLATTADLWAVGTTTAYVVQLPEPPIKYVDVSPVRETLRSEPNPDSLRLYAPGQNVATLLGVAAVPQYLGIGPEEYFDPKLIMPEPLPAVDGRRPHQPELEQWLQRAGVTHILSFEPLDDAWNAEPVFAGVDPFLNGVWARGGEPIYLSRLNNTRGRAFWQTENDKATIELTRRESALQEWSIDSPVENTFVVTELIYPGWRVEIDGVAAEPLRIDGMFRGVRVPPGAHRVLWIYAPQSLYWGAGVSAAILLLLAGIAHVRFWHPQRLRWLDPPDPTAMQS